MKSIGFPDQNDEPLIYYEIHFRNDQPINCTERVFYNFLYGALVRFFIELSKHFNKVYENFIGNFATVDLS